MPQNGSLARNFLMYSLCALVFFANSNEAAIRVAVLPLSSSPELDRAVPHLVRREVERQFAQTDQVVQANALDVERAVGAPWHVSYQLSPGIVASVARDLGTPVALYGSVFGSGSEVRISLGLVEVESVESLVEISRKSATDSASIVSAVAGMGEILKSRLQTLPSYTKDTTDSLVVTVASVPEGAWLTIDGDTVGTTPYTDSNFVPGTHRIALYADRYERFEREIDFPAGSPRKIRVRMRPRFGGVMILGTPADAAVELGDSISGTVPFYHDNVVPGTYRLIVSSPAYRSFTARIDVERGSVDTLDVSLMTQAWYDSLQHAKQIRRRTARRITFGAIGVVLAGTGFFVDREIARRVDDAGAAYDTYNEPGLTASEYDSRYQAYLDAHEEIDKPEGARNILYVLAGVSALGFAISIPF